MVKQYSCSRPITVEVGQEQEYGVLWKNINNLVPILSMTGTLLR